MSWKEMGRGVEEGGVSYERGAPHVKVRWSVGSMKMVRWRLRKGAPLIRGAHSKY
jgi:hypothetical protein